MGDLTLHGSSGISLRVLFVLTLCRAALFRPKISVCVVDCV